MRNEGLVEAKKSKKKEEMLTEVSLEIEDPGAATKVAEDGAITIQESDYKTLIA